MEHSPRGLAAVALAAVIAALTAFIVLSALLTSTFSAAHLWSAAGLLVIIVVTAAVGLVVVRHQPGNPIGWLLAGEAIFMLLNIAAGAYAQLVYDQGVHALSFAGLHRMGGPGRGGVPHLGGGVLAGRRDPPGPQLAPFFRRAPPAAQMAGQRGRGLRRARHLGGQHQLLDLGSAHPRLRRAAREHR
ncbi:MAG TPA: hypothetical protein VGD83_18765, partial [Streptosporangiaceae bacterium]